jgi:hypothetical protein
VSALSAVAPVPSKSTGGAVVSDGIVLPTHAAPGLGTVIKGLKPDDPASVASSGSAASLNAVPLTALGVVAGCEDAMQPPVGESVPNGDVSVGVTTTPVAAAVALSLAAVLVRLVLGHAAMLPIVLEGLTARLFWMAPKEFVPITPGSVGTFKESPFDADAEVAGAPGIAGAESVCAKPWLPPRSTIAAATINNLCITSSCARYRSLTWTGAACTLTLLPSARSTIGRRMT